MVNFGAGGPARPVVDARVVMYDSPSANSAGASLFDSPASGLSLPLIRAGDRTLSVCQSLDKHGQTSARRVHDAAIDPEDRPLTRVQWMNPPVANVYMLPPLCEQDKPALFYTREEEVANRAHVVLESSLLKCVSALVLWACGCWVLVRCTRCLLHGKCELNLT